MDRNKTRIRSLLIVVSTIIAMTSNWFDLLVNKLILATSSMLTFTILVVIITTILRFLEHKSSFWSNSSNLINA